jgi:hypothetical protein
MALDPTAQSIYQSYFSAFGLPNLSFNYNELSNIPGVNESVAPLGNEFKQAMIRGATGDEGAQQSM